MLDSDFKKDISQKNDLLFGSYSQETNQIKLLTSKDFLIIDASLDAFDFFKQSKEKLLHSSVLAQFSKLDPKNTFDLKNDLSFQLNIGSKKFIISKTELYEYFIIIIFPLNDSFTLLRSYVTSIINNLPGAVYWKDIEGRYMGCNKFVAKMAGYNNPEDMIGKTDFDLCWKEFAEEWRNLDKKVLSDNKTLIREEHAKLADGRVITELTFKTPLKNEYNESIGIIGTSLDITELKQTQKELKIAKETAENALESLQKSLIEEQKQRKEAARLNKENTKHKAELEIAKITAEKEQEMRKTVMVLVGDIVHDLRTPIAIIEDGAHILDEIAPDLSAVIKEASELKSEKLGLIDDTQLNYILNKMSTAQKYSVRMINEFIDTTLRELSVAQKYQDGTIAHEELTKCSSRRILENVLDSYPRHNNITINECFPYDFFLMGNSILMMKVLFNLIRNAEEQIIANGKGEITITTKETEDKNLLIVKDTAGGASAQVVENIFKEFFTTKKDGYGIGLAFCKKIMQNFGGDLTCHSIFGESMEFTLSFPKIANPK